MIRRVITALLFGLLGVAAWAATLPPDIKWETNTADPPIGDPKALKGGTFTYNMDDYPLTFRLMGPNSNDSFAGWNRSYTLDFALVVRHPVTDRFIPWMATHWAVMPDNKTVYYKLRPEAKWSDGQPVTADDYVFTFEMMKSPHIVDPFYNKFAEDYFESVEAVEPLTVKIVGKKPSWRPLSDYNLAPIPRHAIKLGPEWIKEYNNTPQVAAGPYVVTQTETGQKVVFEKVKNWWGEDKDYFKGLYNVDRIVLRVIAQERALDYFQKGEIDFYWANIAKIWSENMNFPALKNGWAHRKRVFVDNPVGMYGLCMNLEFPLFQNKDFRKALQYLFDFDKLNKNLMYGNYYRQASFFGGTEYENPNIKPYPFDPRQARAHLDKAGFTKRGGDGILVNDKGQRASFTVIYGTKGTERHLTVLKQIFQAAGVEMKLQLLEGAAAFERGMQRKYEMTLTGRTAGFYPDVYEYFHCKFAKTTPTNNVWGFCTPETDKLIETYMFNMDKQARLAAMHKLDEIIQDEAFYIPFWEAPYNRIVYWDRVAWPEFIFPKRTQQLTDWQVFWIDPEKDKRLTEAKAKNQPLGEDTVIDVDTYGIKQHHEQFHK